MSTTLQATARAAGEAVKAFREYLAVHPDACTGMGGHAMDDMALDLARIALDFPGTAQACLLQICEPAAPARAFPAMTPELEKILGTMCFQTISLSQILRAGGQAIEPRAEAEQAAVLHWMLSLWAVHGDEWRKAAVREVERIREATKETLECST